MGKRKKNYRDRKRNEVKRQKHIEIDRNIEKREIGRERKRQGEKECMCECVKRQ